MKALKTDVFVLGGGAAGFGAILFVVSYNMSEWRKFVSICKTRVFRDISVLIITFALTVIFDLVVAIVAGMIIYYLLLFIEIIIKKGKK